MCCFLIIWYDRSVFENAFPVRGVRHTLWDAPPTGKAQRGCGNQIGDAAGRKVRSAPMGMTGIRLLSEHIITDILCRIC